MYDATFNVKIIAYCLVIVCILCPSFIFSAHFYIVAHLYFLCSVVLCNRWPALMGVSLFLAACHDYVLFE